MIYSHRKPPAMADGGSWYKKLSDATVGWIRYYVVFCKAVPFISALLFSHSLVGYGVVDILVAYLDEKKENLAKVAAIMNVQEGLSAVTKLVIAHISDTWTGCFQMVLYSTAAYVGGFWLLHHSTKLKSSNNVVLYFSLAMVPVAVGTAGRDHTLHAFLGDQMGKQEEPNQPIDEERVQARVQFWSRLDKLLGATVAVVVLGSLKWTECFRVSAIIMTISGFLFLCGFPFYHRKNPTGNPITDVYFVCKAAISKRHGNYPSTPEELYHNDRDELQLSPDVAVLRWLDKAAAIEETSSSTSPEEQESIGMLCPVTQVRKVKLLLTMAPMWTTFLIYSLAVATGKIFFLLQTSNMDVNMIGGVKVPLIYLSLIRSFSSFIASSLYEILVPKLLTQTQQKRAWKVRIGVGMFCSFLSCIVALFVEIHRLKLYKEKRFKDVDKEIIDMSIFWLTPQFCLLGLMEGLCEEGLVDFYNHRVPESIKGYGSSFTKWVLGMGNFVSILWILAFNKWFGKTINDSKLDHYYAVIAIVSFLNQFVYWYVSNMPIYNTAVAEEDVELEEILTDGAEDPAVSESFIPPSHLSIPNSTLRIAAPRTFPEHQSRNAWARFRKNFKIHGLKFSHQRSM